MSKPDVIVIGAGVIGMSAALAIQERGLAVTVLDRKGVAAETSQGNAGCFAFSDIEPLASGDTIGKLPRWFLDPLGPVSIPLRYALPIAPWLLRFLLASRPAKAEKAKVAQASLMALSRKSLLQLLKDTGTEGMLRREGNLEAYESLREYKAGLRAWDERKTYGFGCDPLPTAAAVADVQPGLDAKIVAGIYTPDWFGISDPKDYVEALARVFTSRGGKIEIGEVSALSPAENKAQAVLSNGDVLQAGHVVLSAGGWSHLLAKTLGESIPLEVQRGYNTTLPAGAAELKTSILFMRHAFIITRLSSGIRVGGAVELGGLKLPPNYARADAMLTKAKKFLPKLKTGGGRQWMGYRPVLPDGLPVIGPSSAASRVIYAFGNGHVGLTQSAGTAVLVADLVTGRKPSIDVYPFRGGRF